MVISRTPFRISFFGGGTDYPAWYRVHGGQVLATTIDKYCYLSCRYLPPFFEHRIHVVYSRIERCETMNEIEHPAVREILRYLKVDRGVSINYDGDLPARSGMGSSSSFVVGLLHALHALEGRIPPKQQLATEGIRVEQELLRETVGSQDQVLAAIGGFNHILFHPTGEITVRPMTLPRERIRELAAHLMLFYTGVKRTASAIAASYVPTLRDRETEFKTLGGLVTEGISILTGGNDIRRFGELLHEAWQAKRALSPLVSNPQIERVYELARWGGAIGGKLLGAGGGGFMLLFAPPERQAAVRERLNGFIHVPFTFEFSGSQIIFYDPEVDYADADAARQNQSLVAFEELAESGAAEERVA